jgi:AraC-like DNA-binding protein
VEPTSFFKYLHRGPRDEAWGLYCNDAGMVEIHPGDPYPYQADLHPPEYTKLWDNGRVLNEYQFLYLAKGEGVYRTAGEQHPLREGNLLILVPGVWHWYRPNPATGWTEYWVGFDGAYARTLAEAGFLGPELKLLDVGIHDDIIGHFAQIVSGVAQERPGFQQFVSSLVPLIYAEACMHASTPSVEAKGKLLFERIRAIFVENLYGTLDMESLATDLSLNYSNLREEFKGYTGLSPYQYFLQMKINRAKELLLDGSHSVKEISYTLSFENPYYFSRLFKKKTGVTPSHWNGIETAEG